jgi:hypothetical protein
MVISGRSGGACTTDGPARRSGRWDAGEGVWRDGSVQRQRHGGSPVAKSADDEGAGGEFALPGVRPAKAVVFHALNESRASAIAGRPSVNKACRRVAWFTVGEPQASTMPVA